MKKAYHAFLNLLGIVLLAYCAQAQAPAPAVLKAIEPQHLEISFTKTTHLVFPHAVISADRGSGEVLVQKAKGAENILQVKAAKEQFRETNLTVLTSDGRLHSFLVNYAEAPALLNLQITEGRHTADAIQLSPGQINHPLLQQHAQTAAITLQKIKGVRKRMFGIHFQLDGLLIHDDILYCRLRIENHSPISYDINGIRFFISDRQKVRRTATQEVEVPSLATQNFSEKIPGGTGRTMVFAFHKLTLPWNQYLTIQLSEKNGGRHLALRISNHTITKATFLQERSIPFNQP